jgi:acyl-CoA reductase-like NAD-dependent aldehyde dehydrogenase
MWTIPIALTLGNCVILKPSEKVPLTMQRIASLMIQAGIPAGVFQIIHGAVDVVTSFCDHPDISAVSFVGSSKVAQIVAQRCHSINKRVLALGGAKNHLIALNDCDVSMAARDIVASFAGCAGQRCMAASVLLLVQEPTHDTSDNTVLDQLLSEVISLASKLQPGCNAGQVGPLIDNIAKQRVLSYISTAEGEGDQVLLDGRHWSNSHSDKGFWIGPTVILHDAKNADKSVCLSDEIFGPVLSVLKVSSRDEAIARENASLYGNAACIYTEKGASAEWFVKRFRAGMIGVNIGIPVPRGNL